jgi:hypothetical protein
VRQDGNTTSHVFRGSVKLEPIGTNGGTLAESHILHANESAQVAKTANNGTFLVQPTVIDPTTFVRSAQLSEAASRLRFEAFHRWQAYSREVRRDPSLVAYYDFQPMPGAPAVLRNVAANGDRSRDGTVENATWVSGRMTGKHALSFRGPGDCVRINLPQKTDDLTLAAWVHFDWLNDRPASVLLMSNGWLKPGQACWQVVNTGGCMLFDSVSGASDVARSAIMLGPDLNIRRWMHLACVLDHASARVRFYVDGRGFGAAEYRTNAPIVIGPASIGNWDTEAYRDVDERRNLLGRIDEFAIFGRALAAGEVQRMYEEGSPRQTPENRR